MNIIQIEPDPLIFYIITDIHIEKIYSKYNIYLTSKQVMTQLRGMNSLFAPL
ncbi:MAG: hypothetical protein ACFFCW_12395 [Candidatus Hodarchaeota archaeon]